MKNKKVIIILFLFFFWLYAVLIKVPPVDFWDEHWWIGRSYFFDLFIRGDFNNQEWKGYYSYDQPKLSEYFYGMILYPLYLQEKNNKGSDYEYVNYLTDHNFFSSNVKKNIAYKNKLGNFIDWETNVGSNYGKLLTLYGSGIQKTLSLIFYSRIFSAALLSLSVLIVFLLAKTIIPTVLSFVVASLYSINTIVVYGGLKATSEPLFLFLFNLGLYLIIKVFSKTNISNRFLAFFSLVATLCTQTKLNGVMLLFIFDLLNFIFVFKEIFNLSYQSLKSRFTKIFMVNAIFLIIFILLHPFLYRNQFNNILFLYKWRNSVAVKNQKAYPNTGLFTQKERIFRTYKNFYSEVERNYNLPFIFYQRSFVDYENRFIFNLVKFFIRLKFLLFLTGFTYLTYKTVVNLKNFYLIGTKKYHTLKTSTIFYLASILIFFFVSHYLYIDHLPYFIPLVLAFYIFEGYGFFIFFKLFKLKFKYEKLPKKSQN